LKKIVVFGIDFGRTVGGNTVFKTLLRLSGGLEELHIHNRNLKMNEREMVVATILFVSLDSIIANHQNSNGRRRNSSRFQMARLTTKMHPTNRQAVTRRLNHHLHKSAADKYERYGMYK
jgi:hypothetical protein